MKSKIIDFIIIISSVIFILVFGIMLYFSMGYWTETYQLTGSAKEKMFFASVLAAIVYSSTGFIVKFINTIGKSLRNLEANTSR